MSPAPVVSTTPAISNGQARISLSADPAPSRSGGAGVHGRLVAFPLDFSGPAEGRPLMGACLLMIFSLALPGASV
jgi:hypothetical protein